MSNSESQNRKGKGGRKPKFDYTSEDFLSLVESYAKKGLTDKEIAYAIGILPQTFCEKKSEYTEISEVLARGRATINATVRAKFLAMALGGIKTKSTVVRKLRDSEGNLTGEDELQASWLLICKQCPFGCTTMMKIGERLNANKMKTLIFQQT